MIPISARALARVLPLLFRREFSKLKLHGRTRLRTTYVSRVSFLSEHVPSSETTLFSASERNEGKIRGLPEKLETTMPALRLPISGLCHGLANGARQIRFVRILPPVCERLNRPMATNHGGRGQPEFLSLFLSLGKGRKRPAFGFFMAAARPERTRITHRVHAHHNASKTSTTRVRSRGDRVPEEGWRGGEGPCVRVPRTQYDARTVERSRTCVCVCVCT